MPEPQIQAEIAGAISSFPSRESALAWAAGLFEGEGSLCALRRKGYVFLAANVTSTDLDVLERFAGVVGLGNINEDLTHRVLQRKRLWRWETRRLEEVRALGHLLAPYLGIRRRAKLVEILAARNESEAQLAAREDECLSCGRLFRLKRSTQSYCDTRCSNRGKTLRRINGLA